jgi:hypothetical protein
MSKLIAFGDSFTYGHWLDITDKLPSKSAWPSLLGNILGIETINKSVPGYSNIQILKDILTSPDIQAGDTVIVGWTYSLRDYIFRKNLLNMDTSIQVSPWHENKKFVKQWATVHNDYDLSIRAGLYINHAECYLKIKPIKQFHFCAYQGFFQVLPEFIVRPENFIKQVVLPRIDKALDNEHPGRLSHKQAAETLYKILNDTK